MPCGVVTPGAGVPGDVAAPEHLPEVGVGADGQRVADDEDLRARVLRRGRRGGEEAGGRERGEEELDRAGAHGAEGSGARCGNGTPGVGWQGAVAGPCFDP